MRICVVTLDFRPVRTSGLAVYGELLVDGYLARGHSVVVITSMRPELNSRETIGALEIRRVHTGRFDWLGLGIAAARAVSRLESTVRIDRCHVLDVHFGYALTRPFVASAFQSFRQRATADQGIPYHTTRADLLFRRIYYSMAERVLEARAVRNSAHIIMGSQSTLDAYRAHYALNERKSSVIPLGIDTDFFSPRPAPTLRRRLGLEGKRVILHVGFAAPRKGLDVLLRALASLPEDVILVQVGRWNASYKAQLHRTFGTVWHRIIEAGYVEDQELPLYYSLADIAAFPSLLEGFGLPVVEAMACQVPVIAARAGSLPEVVGDAGLLFTPGDDVALGKLISECLDDRERRNMLGKRGRDRTTRLYTADKMVTRTLEALVRFG